MKRIMILGATVVQMPLINMAKSFGYYVAVCDWTTTSPGIAVADSHHQVNILDKDLVLKAAKEEKIDGIISNYDPAMPIVAYVSEQLGLIGNSSDGIETLNSKAKFRALQRESGLYFPQSITSVELEDFMSQVSSLTYPIIIKPCKSSATRGTKKFEKFDERGLKESFEECHKLSVNDIVCAEEYVEMPSLNIIDGDVFVYGDDIIWDGMFMSTRSPYAPMVPTTQTYPLSVKPEQYNIVKESLTAIFKNAGVKFGEYNVEMYFNKDGKLFVIEINPRQGGNGIPSAILRHCGIDFTKLLVTLAVGDTFYYEEVKNLQYDKILICRHPVYCHETGTFKEISIAEEIKQYISGIEILKQNGDEIRGCVNALDEVGFINLEFDSNEVQLKYAYNLEKYITVKLS